MRATFAALALAALPCAASAEDGRIWAANVAQAQVAMYYGTPESDDVVISFTCDFESRRVFVHAAIEAKGVKAGGRAMLVLAGPGGTARLPAVGFADDVNGFTALEAEISSSDQALAPLKGTGTLAIEAPGSRTTVPLGPQAARAVETFRSACPAGH